MTDEELIERVIIRPISAFISLFKPTIKMSKEEMYNFEYITDGHNMLFRNYVTGERVYVNNPKYKQLKKNHLTS